jgi:hypothetical protein
LVDDPPAAIRATSKAGGAAREVARLWPAAARSVAQELRLTAPAVVEVVLADHRTFRRWSGGFLPEWGVGYASWPTGPIVIDVDSVLQGEKTLDEVLRHEISHVYLGQKAPHAGWPRWFVEGVAQWQAGEWRFLDTLSLVRAGTVGTLPRLDRIGQDFPAGGRPAQLAYLVSLRALLEIDERLSDAGGWGALVEAASSSGRFDLAFRELLGMSPADFAVELGNELDVKFGWLAAIANVATLFTAMTLLFLAGVGRAYWRKNRRLAEMEREEQALFNGPSDTSGRPGA